MDHEAQHVGVLAAMKLALDASGANEWPTTGSRCDARTLKESTRMNEAAGAKRRESCRAVL
jgi:hypothetical protein